MNIFKLSYKQIKSKPLSSLLNIILFTTGISIIFFLLIIKDSIEKQLERNVENIDLVVGAKGSPLQLILCGIYHIDYPTGNIPYEDAIRLAKHDLVKQAIPLALGDNYKGFRIVGTNQDYPTLYKGSITEGSLWKETFNVAIGSKVAKSANLKIGDTFSGMHGLIEGTGHEHADTKYKVTGIFAESGTVLDQLILTDMESVWEIHAHHEHEEDESEELEAEEIETDTNESLFHREEHSSANHNHHEHEGDDHDEEHVKEITSLLITYKNPMGAITLPRFINQSTNMQAASPAQEINRLYSLMGIGIQAIQLIAYFIIFVSALSIFISLYNSLKDRKYELALIRVMGGSRTKIFTSIILEGISIAILGYIVGFVISRIGMLLLASYAEDSFHYNLKQWISINDIYLLIISLLIGFAAAIIPAIKAMGTDISKTLSE